MASNVNKSEIEQLDSPHHAIVNCPDLLSNNESCTRLLGPTFDKLVIIKVDGNWRFIQKELPFVSQPVRLLECFQNFLFYVGKGSHKVVVCDLENKDIIYNEFMFDEDVQGIKFRAPFIFFILANRISIYMVNDAKNEHESKIRPFHEITNLRNITPNTVSIGRNAQRGRCEIIVACPTSEQERVGELQLYSLLTKDTKHTIQAHESELSCVNINRGATKIATASRRGTLVRIFNEAGDKLLEFRRGLSYASIKSLIFCPKSKYLSCTSDHGTIHIFKVEEDELQLSYVSAETWPTYLTGLVTDSVTSTAKYVMQGTSAESLFSERSFATIPLDKFTVGDPSGVKTHGFVEDHRGNIGVLVSHFANIASIFRIDTQNGGECQEYSHFVVAIEH